MKKKIKLKGNYFDSIPVIKPGITWDADDDGIVVVHMENIGFFNKVAQRFFHKPKISHIHLDEIGSYIWINIDSESSLYDISTKLQEHFGKKVDPLYDRLVKYVQILERCNFIFLKNAETENNKPIESK